jgi:hypothetical protein
MVTDHINRNRYDNRLVNLRYVSPRINMQNTDYYEQRWPFGRQESWKRARTRRRAFRRFWRAVELAAVALDKRRPAC